MSVSNVKKGLSAIASEVLADVQKESAALIADAKKEATQTLKKAKEEAESTYLTVVNQAQANAEAEKRKIASLTEVEMRSRLLSTKEALVDTAFERAVADLREFVKTEGYHAYLLRDIEKSAKRIGSKKLVLQVNSDDRAWLTQGNLEGLSKKLRSELALSEQTTECLGGCRVQSADGRVVYDDTLDNRLQELKSALRVEVAKILFGGGAK